MLDFFRRHQKYFFWVITVVIVISFSFFGTYSTITTNDMHDQTAFVTVDGTNVTRRDLEEMVVFLGSDASDKMLYGGAWGPNFLNDGVIKKDFLETGLADLIVAQYPEEIKSDLYNRLEKEKRYSLYTHPQAHFISVDGAWGYFAPGMRENFTRLRHTDNPISADAFNARVSLYLGEQKFPSPLVRQVLRYQEKQYSWLEPDPSLDYVDLTLFGYHSTEDWFGPRFMRIVAEFIFNAADIAEKKGYKVSPADALADLVRNSETSFQQNIHSPHLGVATGSEYFSEQLRRLGMDQAKAVKIWQKVLLFRRIFQDVGNSVFVDPQTYKELTAFALESAQGDLYRLPEELRLNNYRALQKLQFYINAVSKQSPEALLLPTTFTSPSEIAKTTPELVAKRYLLDVAQADKKNLQSKVTVRDAWNWEMQEANWAKIKQQFPELGIKKGDSREERFAALESLDDRTRARVDLFARNAIVDAHPEWLSKALDEAPVKREIVFISEKGSPSFVTGLKNNRDLIQLLDAAAIGGRDSADKLGAFTGDDQTFYRITVVDRDPQAQTLTFAEADKAGILDKMLDQKLEAYYIKMREGFPKEFQKEDQSWQPFEDVKNAVADHYFEKLLRAIRDDYAAGIAPEKAPQTMISDYAASLRLFSQARQSKKTMEQDPSSIAKLAQESKEETPGDKLPERIALTNQWKWVRMPYHVSRSTDEDLLNKKEVFSMPAESWSKVRTLPNGDITFFHLKQKGEVADKVVSDALKEKIAKARELLSDDAQQQLMKRMLAEIKEKHAISLEYLNRGPEMTEMENS